MRRVIRRLRRGLRSASAYPELLTGPHREAASRASPGNLARALVLEDFLNVVPALLEAMARPRVAVVGGYADEPELRALREQGRDVVVTLYGVDGADVHLDLNANDLEVDPELGGHDLVLCSQVFEHIWNHRAATATLRGLLAEGGYLWLAAPASNRPHGWPDYFLAGMTDEYLRRLLIDSGVDVVAQGQIGSRRLYESVHTLPTWLSVKGHACPPLYAFDESAVGTGTAIGRLARTTALYAVSGRVTRDPQTATESWVLARRPPAPDKE